MSSRLERSTGLDIDTAASPECGSIGVVAFLDFFGFGEAVEDVGDVGVGPPESCCVRRRRLTGDIFFLLLVGSISVIGKK